ncbi:hypothetical protein JG687_00010882 [Phytophthora cactorum]|uniref:Uncharacterized protein n=2 Tax=Phytophthora TaxID=4783 RepID=A0A8J5IIB5_9STRA|nr:hypothetical protein JG687_00010882 [Phytophthora cactorum]KAG6958457.1 hypothetical protein JG688_00010499 [Phytophthora aleatoria]
MGYALLWQTRNQMVHENKTWIASEQLKLMWTSCIRQLSSIARKEYTKPHTRTKGLQLQLSIDCLTSMDVEAPQDDEPHPPPAP